MRELARIVALCLLVGSPAAWSQSVARLTGMLGGTGPTGSTVSISFSCTGSNPCTGTYSARLKAHDCSNAYFTSDLISVAVSLPSQPGPISGTAMFKNALPDSDTVHPDGTCTMDSVADFSTPFTGTWDGTVATVTAPLPTDSEGQITLAGTIRRDSAAPPFEMTVTATISTRANVAAQIQYRPQDVGTTGSVYVFALAPAPRVQGVTASSFKVGEAKRADGLKTDAVPCVLAQLNSTGRLVAVSAASLQAYLTGALSAQGASVSVLNNVTTANVAGATMFVGYGTTSASMINDGINRAAVTVPGTVECRPEGPQTGWWWNTAEGGRGYSIERQGRNLFMAAYFYDASGRATWQVASGPTTLEGALFTAPLYSCTGGVTLAGAYRANTCTTNSNVTLAFNTASTGTMVWPGGTVGIERFNIVANGLNATPLANQPENGWWWSEAENGRGFFIEWQGGTADIAGYMYDDAGNPIWYITVIGTPNPLAMNGAWWQFANGMTQAGPYRPATRVNDNVGPATIQFQSATTATMTLPGGRQIALTRFRF